MSILILIVSVISLVLRVIEILRKGHALTHPQRRRLEQLLSACNELRSTCASYGITPVEHTELHVPAYEDLVGTNVELAE